MNQKKLLLKVIDDVKGSNKEKWVHFCYVPEEVYTRFFKQQKEGTIQQGLGKMGQGRF